MTTKNSDTILIADDDQNLVNALALRCQTLGLGVQKAYDGLTALKTIERERPDLVILDINMPGGNGLSVRELMAGNKDLDSIPVIVLTGSKNIETMRRCHELLAYFVPKCDDIWSRIQPLLLELLGLGRPDASSPDVAGLGKENAPPCTPIGKGSEKAALGNKASGREKPDEIASNPSATEFSVPQVLCIDDDEELCALLRMRLESQGIGFLPARAGRMGYGHAFIQAPQAIILDYELPDGNGDYVLRRLKESVVTKDIPVIVLTGHRDKCLERKMYNLGAVQLFNKPLNWNELWNELQTYLH